jgi:hypothetical protein
LTAFETKGPKAGSQKGRTIIEAIFWKYPRRVRHESPPPNPGNNGIFEKEDEGEGISQ